MVEYGFRGDIRLLNTALKTTSLVYRPPTSNTGFVTVVQIVILSAVINASISSQSSSSTVLFLNFTILTTRALHTWNPQNKNTLKFCWVEHEKPENDFCSSSKNL